MHRGIMSGNPERCLSYEASLCITFIFLRTSQNSSEFFSCSISQLRRFCEQIMSASPLCWVCGGPRAIGSVSSALPSWRHYRCGRKGYPRWDSPASPLLHLHIADCRRRGVGVWPVGLCLCGAAVEWEVSRLLEQQRGFADGAGWGSKWDADFLQGFPEGASLRMLCDTVHWQSGWLLHCQ